MNIKSSSLVVRKVQNGYTVTVVVNGEDVIKIARSLTDVLAFVEEFYLK